ncbi:YaiI/YqxD family protein [Treponema phagedenis]|uniref:YaiI/YqxD family protein n=1 Tax=Treponema phagedenis TaxID=162 RepID=UPI0011E69B12|nr:DUF188 domain-containing protein [Treponema phagedenis]QEK07505.1 DUF188 domain-containing protein [Treponema phagedenis]
MRLLVDSDSCPAKIRSIICKTAKRLKVEAVFVANRPIPVANNPFCSFIQTGTESQAADIHILNTALSGDIVITRDIPLAKALIDKNILVINDRGTVYTKENINERLSIRNFMYKLQEYGLTLEKTKTFGKKEISDFAQALDRETTKLIRHQQNEL